MKKFIAYCRVSTQKQSLGLDAQMTAIRAYVAADGGVIVAEFSEKESGKEAINRPQLNAAITAAKQLGAVLLVSKLDRLSRDVADIFTLKKDKRLTFEVCDMNASDTLMLGIFATLAQKERELISRRTKEGLAEAKKKGKKLGGCRAAGGWEIVSASGRAALHDAAINHPANRHAYDAIRLMDGTLQSKCDYLNGNGYTTRNGKRFTPKQVSRLLAMYA